MGRNGPTAISAAILTIVHALNIGMLKNERNPNVLITRKERAMKALLIGEFNYLGGMFIQPKYFKKNQRREVDILGVMSPVDPGMVVIQDGDKQKEVPTFMLKCDGWRRIDFAAMLTDEQLKVRVNCGGLMGCGVSEPRTLVPLSLCPRVMGSRYDPLDDR